MPQVENEPRQLIVGAILMLATGIIQTLGVVALEELVDRIRDRVTIDATRARMLGVSSGVICYLFALHLLEMTLWAAFYDSVADLPSFATALYESALAFTTMDIAQLPPRWKFLSAAEGTTGLLMFAWSTSLLFNHTAWVTDARRRYLRKHRLFGARDRSTPES
jgi:Na+/proline symporter